MRPLAARRAVPPPCAARAARAAAVATAAASTPPPCDAQLQGEQGGAGGARGAVNGGRAMWHAAARCWPRWRRTPAALAPASPPAARCVPRPRAPPGAAQLGPAAVSCTRPQPTSPAAPPGLPRTPGAAASAAQARGGRPAPPAFVAARLCRRPPPLAARRPRAARRNAADSLPGAVPGAPAAPCPAPPVHRGAGADAAGAAPVRGPAGALTGRLRTPLCATARNPSCPTLTLLLLPHAGRGPRWRAPQPKTAMAPPTSQPPRQQGRRPPRGGGATRPRQPRPQRRSQRWPPAGGATSWPCWSRPPC